MCVLSRIILLAAVMTTAACAGDEGSYWSMEFQSEHCHLGDGLQVSIDGQEPIPLRYCWLHTSSTRIEVVLSDVQLGSQARPEPQPYRPYRALVLFGFSRGGSETRRPVSLSAWERSGDDAHFSHSVDAQDGTNHADSRGTSSARTGTIGVRNVRADRDSSTAALDLSLDVRVPEAESEGIAVRVLGSASITAERASAPPGGGTGGGSTPGSRPEPVIQAPACVRLGCNFAFGGAVSAPSCPRGQLPCHDAERHCCPASTPYFSGGFCHAHPDYVCAGSGRCPYLCR